MHRPLVFAAAAATSWFVLRLLLRLRHNLAHRLVHRAGLNVDVPQVPARSITTKSGSWSSSSASRNSPLGSLAYGNLIPRRSALAFGGSNPALCTPTTTSPARVLVRRVAARSARPSRPPGTSGPRHHQHRFAAHLLGRHALAVAPVAHLGPQPRRRVLQLHLVLTGAGESRGFHLHVREARRREHGDRHDRGAQQLELRHRQILCAENHEERLARVNASRRPAGVMSVWNMAARRGGHNVFVSTGEDADGRRPVPAGNREGSPWMSPSQFPLHRDGSISIRCGNAAGPAARAARGRLSSRHLVPDAGHRPAISIPRPKPPPEPDSQSSARGVGKGPSRHPRI